jgi:uncharacterized protein YbcI
MADTHPDVVLGGSKAAALSNAVVRTLSAYTGRGPTKARAHITENLVAVVLEDTLTKGERSLVRDGRTTHVLDTRKAYQRTMATDLIASVEEILGRKVIAFMSDNHIDPDIAVETFVLEPRSRSEDVIAEDE